jgi:hypothetical protein
MYLYEEALKEFKVVLCILNKGSAAHHLKREGPMAGGN